MSLTPNSARTADTRSGRPWAIASRLTLHYAGSTLAILLLGGGFLYWGLARELHQQDKALVASKLWVLRHLTAEYPAGAEALASEIEHEAGEEAPLHYYLRVRDGRGVTLLETPGMIALVPPGNFPSAIASPADLEVCATCALSADGRYLLVSGTSESQGPGRTPLGLQVALQVSTTARVLADYRTKLLFVLIAGLLAALGVGVAIARLALRPVEDISQLVRGISASRLDATRIGERLWPAELRDLAGAFDAMLARLQDAFSRLTQFSADLAHALRNPINNLRGEAEVALARTRNAEEYQQVLASSLDEYARLARLIDGLLFIARSEDPRHAIESTRFPSRRELDAVRDFYEALAAERSISVSCEGEAWLSGDPVLFRRCVSNLLANALNNTPDGGRVTLRVIEQPDGRVEVSVRDTGRGIDGSHLPHVFERFYRVEEGQIRETNGAGLGLPIVQSIMRLHGGSARIESAMGRGTTITLEFPATPPVPVTA